LYHKIYSIILKYFQPLEMFVKLI